jgi:hypothetical protein
MIVLALTSGTSLGFVGDPTLVFYYSFDDVDDVVLDESGKGHHGTVEGDVTADPDGKRDGAARFEGVGGPAGHSYLDLDGENIPAEDIPTSGITLAAWVKCENTGGHHAIFNARASDATWLIHPEVRSNNQFRWLLRAAGSVKIFDMRVGLATWDEWLHYAGTYDKASGKAFLYINGEVVGETNVTSPKDIAGDWGRGARVGYNIDDNRPFTGLMDELYLFRRALSESEINELKDVVIAQPYAHRPNPRDGATDVEHTPTLSWSPGLKAVSHNVYFSESFDEVSDGTAFKGNQAETSYGPLSLELGREYFWRVDEVVADGAVIDGRVWSFTVAPYILVDDFEDYNNYSPDRVFDTWPGGYTADDRENNGSIVGHLQAPFAEQTIVHSGYQAMPMSFDNSGPANLSEAVANVDDLKSGRDWTALGVKALSLRFRGYPAYMGDFVEGPGGMYTITGTGAGISGTDDEFHFAFKEVSGACTIVARVDSITDTDDSAKAGVMIRDSRDPNSTYAMVCITPDNGLLLEHRSLTGGDSVRLVQRADIEPPQWVQLERTIGGLMRASYSADGSTWIPLGILATVRINLPVHVGLAVTSNDISNACIAEFSNVSFPNTSAPGPWTDEDVGIKSNDPEPMYVALSNSNGMAEEVYHDDPNATLVSTWTEWSIDLKQFSDKGIDLADVDKVFIGFGYRDAPQPGGTGMMYFDDIRLYLPRCLPDKLAPPPGDATNDCVVDMADLEIMAGDWMQGDFTVHPAEPQPAVAQWQFNGNLLDSAGGNNGTAHGGLQYADGKDGLAIDFDGSDDFVTVSDSAQVEFGDQSFSVALWVSSDFATGADKQFVLCNGTNGSEYDAGGTGPGGRSSGKRYVIKFEGVDLRFLIDDDVVKTVANGPSDSFAIGDWVHIGAVRDADNGELRIYRNGVLEVTQGNVATGDISSPGEPLYIGAKLKENAHASSPAGAPVAHYFDGLLDDLRMYDYALSQGEVLGVAGLGQLYMPLTSLAEFYDAEPINSRLVNLKDYAILADNWLEERFWPE